MVLAVALVLVVLRRNEALDREVWRSLQHLLDGSLGRRGIAELRVACRDKCPMTLIGAANALERLDGLTVAPRDEISAAEMTSRSALDDRG